MSARRTLALATLARLGVDPAAVARDAAPDPSVDALLAGPDGAALADALGELGTAATAGHLAGLVAALPDKDVQKAVRRALFRLGQRGVVVPAAAPLAGPPPRLLRADAGVEGFVSGIDGRGDRIVWLVKRQADGATLVVAAELNEPGGLRDVRVFETTRKQLRETRTRLERETGIRLVAADWRALDALLVEGQDRAGTTARDWRRLRGRITAEPPASPAELASHRVTPPAEAEVAGLARDAVALLAEPEVRTWWPDPTALQPVLDELAQLRDSPLVLAPAQQEERIRALLERAATSLYPPAVTARRLEATAYVLAERGRASAARQALATAHLLRHQPAPSAPPPLVAALVQQAVAARYASAQAERTDARRDALVVTPGEFLTARSPSRPGRTPA